MANINPFFVEEIKKYGADNFQACFNCGNCTAICSLSDKSVSFPRMMVRYGTLGMKEEILGSMEPWLCYSCGDCTETCPRQANPGHYMAALRRYSIAHYEPTGLTRLLFKSNPFVILFTLILATVLGIFLFTLKPEFETARWLFRILPFAVIHNMGLMIFLLTGISVFTGIFIMLRHLSKTLEKPSKSFSTWKALTSVVNELISLKRYQNCDKKKTVFGKTNIFILNPGLSIGLSCGDFSVFYWRLSWILF